MAADNDSRLFFVDSELIERLLRGDTAPGPAQQQRPVSSAGFAAAVALASEGRIDDAVRELESAAERGEDAMEVQTGLGHLRFEQRKWSEAQAHYARAAQLEPRHPTAHYNLGLCLERQSKFEDAATAFEAALSVEPKRWQAQLGRGLCRLRLGQPEAALGCFESALTDVPGQEKDSHPDRILFAKAVALHQLGRLDEAADLYEKLLPASPHSVDLLSNLISLSLVRKDEARVKELAERLLKIQPESRPALEGLAGIALSRGNYSTAVEHCSRLVKVEANSYQGWFNLGVAYQKVGRLEQAVYAYREAVRLRPDSAEANANLGAALQERGDLDGARAACQHALDASPQLPGALWNLAIATERQGNVQEAEKLFEKLVAVQPDWEDAAFRLGYLQFQRAQYAAAVDSFEICLKKRQGWTDALLNLGLASWKCEDLETAASTFRRVLSLDPGNSAAMGCLATVLVDQKNSGEALGWYRKLKTQPAPELSYNLGLLLQLAGDHAAAAGCYQAAVDRKPGFSQALLNLGHALRAAGKEDEAQQAWSKAVAADPQLAGQYFQ
jgi:tetratricopeptide (TPR) repeat protein